MTNSVREWAQGYLDKALVRGPAYTSLDAMKLFAIINMTCDHLGFYFFPDQLWWRAIGRITFPVWFFLAGYSRGRAINEWLWAYAILLVFLKVCVGDFFFPLNALISIILCRMVLNFCEDKGLMTSKLPYVLVACMLLSFVTPPLFEYGSIAFMYAIFGRLVATKQKQHLVLTVVTGYLTFIFWQYAWFCFREPNDLNKVIFTPVQMAYVVFGTAWVVWWLATFKNIVLWPEWRTSKGKTFVTILSRNTMPYYFYHRLLFETLAAHLTHGIHFALLI